MLPLPAFRMGTSQHLPVSVGDLASMFVFTRNRRPYRCLRKILTVFRAPIALRLCTIGSCGRLTPKAFAS